MFVLDTNVLIYYANGERVAIEFFERHEREVFYLPTLAVVEFLSYPLLAAEAVAKFKQFASQTILLNLNFAIAELAAELRRIYRMKLADAVIAASALISGSALVTRNIRDFKKVKGLHIAEF